jgi:hypothetical protein
MNPDSSVIQPVAQSLYWLSSSLCWDRQLTKELGGFGPRANYADRQQELKFTFVKKLEAD